MEKDKTYYLSVDSTEAENISEALSKVYGYLVSACEEECDPKTGQPLSRKADMLKGSLNSIEILQRSLSKQIQIIKSVNMEVHNTRKALADDIIKAMSSATSSDLFTAIVSAIDKYEIIGKVEEPRWDEDNIPF